MDKFKNLLSYVVILILVSIIIFLIFLNIPARPIVSVVMPVYNREKLVPYAIESVLNQTYTDFEFLILDDGSTDGTLQVLQNYAKKDSRIKILKNETNKGIPFSRNKLQKEARGKYLTIMDSDDQMFKDLLEKSVYVLEHDPSLAAVYTERVLLDKNLKPKEKVLPFFPIILMLQDNVVSNSGNTVRKSFVDQHRISYKAHFKTTEDYDYWSQILMNGGKIGFISIPLIAIRFHHDYPRSRYMNMFENRKIISMNLCIHSKVPLHLCETGFLCDKIAYLYDNNIYLDWAPRSQIEYIYKKICQ